jgi:beta-1,4-N-acetylglucosaminyltransferase
MKKVLVVASGGGHVDQAVAVLPCLHGAHIELATYAGVVAPTAEDIAVKKLHRMFLWGEVIGLKLAFSLCVNFVQFLILLVRNRPDVILSTGSEMAIPAFLIGRCMPGTVLIHLETAIRVHDLSLSGKVLLRLSDYFFVQWPGLEEKYKGEVRYIGRIF